MRMIFAAMLVVGLGLAGFAVYTTQQQFQEYQRKIALQERELKTKIPLVKVYVAKKPLRYGDILKREDVAAVPWPKTAVPKGAFVNEKTLFPEGYDDKPRYVLRAMEAGEPLMKVKVTEPGQDAGVASRLEAGKRAFAIRVDVASGVSGFLRPDDRVDIYWTGEALGRDVTKLIMENVRLIAVDQITDKDRNKPIVPRTVTVEASPEQIAILAQAQADGKLSLSLRSNRDDSAVGAEAVQVDKLAFLGIKREKPKIAKKIEAPKVCTIRTRKGAEVSVIEVPCPGTN